jgi:uncharacterized protein YndB with AHSA1/START domain
MVLDTAAMAAAGQKQQITIERTYDAPADAVWEMWTTKEGLESWWGPERFTSTVLVLELRAGGRLHIEMKSEDPEIVAYLKSQGQATVSVEKITFVEISPVTRLTFKDYFDHAPGVTPYEVNCAVTFTPVGAKGERTRMVFVGDAMHDAHWTQMATMGWEQQLDKLAAVLGRARDEGATR